ncbi:MAG TPA: hypothetical protein VHM31_19010 [Polyangia bacterium]|nr:hypothetical protein [Polyangia bacterium]
MVKPDRAPGAQGGVRRETRRRFGGLGAGEMVGAAPSVGSGIVVTAPPARPVTGAAAASVVRVLIGGGPGAAEARIRIADGAGGCAELRLISVSGGRAVAAQLLTAAAGSRETLAGVMNELRLRLRRRGIALIDLAGGESPLGRERDGRCTP